MAPGRDDCGRKKAKEAIVCRRGSSDKQPAARWIIQADSERSPGSSD